MKHKNNCLLLLIGALIVIVIFSPLAGFCSSSEPSLKAPLDKPGVQKKASATQGTASVRIDKVTVSDVKNAYRVTITAVKMPAYTVYKLAKPDRIIVDIPGMIVDQKASLPVQLQNNLISGIKANTIDKNGTATAHIEILLKHAALYDAIQQETSLLIDIAKSQLVSEQKAPSAQEPLVNKLPAIAAASPATRKLAAEKEIPEKLLIKNISITATPSGYQVAIAADAEIKNYHPFTLQKPARLAIDFPAATCSVPRTAQNINNSLVKTIRIGSANDKVRFVIDFATPALPKYQIAQKGQELLVMLDTPRRDSVRDSVAGSPAPVKMTSSSAVPTEQKDPVETDKIASNTACGKNNIKPSGGPVKQTTQKKSPETSPAAAAEPSPVAAAGETAVYRGQKISLDFKDADIKNILRLIADVSGLNIITSDRVAGKVTLKLEDIPWDQALDIILESNNLGKIIAGNIIRVDTKDQIFKSQKDKLEQTSLEDLIMETVPVSYVKAKDIERYIKDLKVLTDKRGSINSFEHTNTITITDVPGKVKRIKQLIQEQDIPTRQVLIEARIVQSNPNYVKELGVVWGNLYNTTKDGGKAKGGADIGVSGAAGGGSVVNLPAAVGLGSGGGINFGYITNSLQLDIQLTALEKDEKLKIVSSPKILGIDNKEARIKQGVALPYLKLSEQGVTSTEFKDAVLELKVTPKITPANTVSLHVFVTKNQKSAQTGAGGEPGIDIREVESDLLIENGKTVVIGGIYETTRNNIVNKVPFFGNLPFFGYFFRNTRVEDALTEILVFLTVNIVYQPQITGQISAEK